MSMKVRKDGLKVTETNKDEKGKKSEADEGEKCENVRGRGWGAKI